MAVCVWCKKEVELGWWRILFWLVVNTGCPHCRRPIILKREWVTKKPESFRFNGRR